MVLIFLINKALYPFFINFDRMILIIVNVKIEHNVIIILKMIYGVRFSIVRGPKIKI